MKTYFLVNKESNKIINKVVDNRTPEEISTDTYTAIDGDIVGCYLGGYYDLDNNSVISRPELNIDPTASFILTDLSPSHNLDITFPRDININNSTLSITERETKFLYPLVEVSNITSSSLSNYTLEITTSSLDDIISLRWETGVTYSLDLQFTNVEDAEGHIFNDINVLRFNHILKEVVE